jgi:hypothetical protein
MLKTLNSFSGLSLTTPTALIDARWIVGIMIFIRQGLEDISPHYFVQRVQTV